MKKAMMALALCLMSAIGFAANRQMVTVLPSNTPSVNLTINGQTHKVQPTKAVVKEVDDKHIKCIVYAGQDKAEVILPVTYDMVLKLGAHFAEICHTLNVVSDQQYNAFLKWYNQQTID